MYPDAQSLGTSKHPFASARFSGSVFDNMRYVFDLIDVSKVSAHMLLAIPWLLWGIWKNRNEFLFENKQGDMNFLVTHAVEEVELWKKVKDKEKSMRQKRYAPYSSLVSH